METLQLKPDPSEVLGGHLVSLSSGDVLHESGLIFAPESLSTGIITSECNSDEVQTFMSIPVQMVQDNSYVVPLVLKNAAGNTFLLDPRQCGLLNAESGEDTQSHYIITPGVDTADGDQPVAASIMGVDMDYSYVTNVGNLVLDEAAASFDNNVDANHSTILHLGSQVIQDASKLLPEGMCIDMSQLSIVTSNGVVSYMATPSTESDALFPTTNNNATQQINSCVPLAISNSDHIQEKEIKEHTEETPSGPVKNVSVSQPVIRRRRGRPRKMDCHVEEIVDPPVGKPPYRCDTCGYEAALWGRLKRHKQSHLNEKPHRCPLCPVSFNVEANLTLHMATHDQDQLKCPECQRVFTRVASLRSHLMLHEREDNLFCTECGDEFALQYQLDSHVMEHQEEWAKKNMEKVYECQSCLRQFTRSSALKEHMREHLKVKQSLIRRKHDRTQDRSDFSQKCSNCGKVFQKPSQLLRHMRIHTGERPFSCEVCGKAFNQKGSLQIHMTKHNGEKPYQCEFCSARFSQKGNLRAHIQRVHSIPEQGVDFYRCSECPCIFRKLGSLNSHVGRAHSQVDGEKNPKTESLNSTQMMQVNVDQIMAQLAALEKATGKSGNSSQEKVAEAASGRGGQSQTELPSVRVDSSDILQQAISKSGLEGKSDPDQGKEKVTAVTGYITLADKSLDGTVRRYTIRQRKVGRVRWHQCSYCCKEFKKPSDLVRHIRIHTHEKPFKCPHCFRAFSVKSTLTSHIRTHGGLKHYTCPECDKKFSTTSSLKVHQRLHNGERPFACSLCSRTFRTSGHRQSHWLSHCEEKGEVNEGNEGGKNKKKKKKKLIKKEETDENLPEVLLEEPIVISEAGLLRSGVGNPKPEDSSPRLHHCTQCKSAFRKSSHLKMHLRIHSGERPFQCNICNRSFVTNGVLKAHVLTHQSLKAYTCSVCSNTFSTHGSLKRHMYRHDENRPFMCPYCHKTFKHKITCKKHMQVHKVELARAAAQQPKGLGEQQFVVSVEDNFNSGDIILPNFQDFTGEPVNSNNASEGSHNDTVTLEGDKLLPHGSVITHTLLADASGTITLPDTLTQESIREIEETLNQQLSSRGSETALINSCGQSEIPLGSLAVSTDVNSNTEANSIDISAASEAAHAEDVAAAANLAASENMPEEDLNGRPKETENATTASDLSATIFSQTFDQQTYDACAFPAITLQGDQLTLSGIEQGATLSANMEAILPQSCIGERRRNHEISTDNDGGNVESSSLGIVEDFGERLENIDPHGSGEQTYIAETRDEVQKDIPYIHETNETSEKGETFVSDSADIIVSTESSGNQSSNMCKLCNKTFKRPSLLKSHLVSVHGANPKPHICSYCGRSFASANGLKLHERNHVGVRSYVCEHCSLSFASNGSLARHMAIHSEKRPFSCSQCSDTFRNQNQLSKHLKSHSDSGSKNQRSKIPTIILSEEQTSALANQSVDLASTVSERILIASALELNRGDDSPKTKQLEQEPVYPNQCEFCTKSFRKPSDLVRHVRIHTGERPFRCNYCPKSFTVKSTLDAHQKTHMSGLSKMFPCHVCNLRFSTKGSLKVHMRLHTGSKPFKCGMCNLRFRTSGHRKAHMQSHGSPTSRTRKVQNLTPKEIDVPPVQQVSGVDSGLEQQPMLTHQILTEDGSVVSVNAADLLAAGANINGSHLQLQINDSFLQHLQFQEGGNVVIGPNDSSEFMTSNNTGVISDDGDHSNPHTIEDQNDGGINQHQATGSTSSHQILPAVMPPIDETSVKEEQSHSENPDGGEISNIHFEIHTDEHGQIVNIQQTMDGRGVILADIGDINLSDVGKVSIDASQFQILDGVEGVNVGGIAGAVDGFVTLDISNIIVAPPAVKKGRGSKHRNGSSSDGPSSHPCSVCNKVFSKPSQLERHVRIHTGERPFPCPQCWKAFNQTNALKAHMKRHTGERPFKCPHCDHAFTQRGNLKTHIGRAHPQQSSANIFPRRRKTVCTPKHLVDDVSLNLDLEGVVNDLFPQMHSAEESEVV